MLIKMPQNYNDLDDDGSFLCCCEYFNANNERSHLLGCCCDCQDVDEYFERSITRQPMPNNIYCNMYRTVQDRCRIPWKGGARLIPLDIIIPIILLPVLARIAAMNCWLTFAVFLSLPFIVCSFMKKIETCNQNSKFFFSWTLTSCALLMSVFEFLVVPQLEILPEENCIFMAFVLLASIFIYYTRNTSVISMGEYCDIESESSTDIDRFCRLCRMKQPLRVMHCTICNHCILKGEYHCVWLDCCIGGRNLMKFLLGLLFASLALGYGSYLTLTTVCHPFLLMDAILVPDDCSDVFFDTNMALCFVSGAYSLLVAAVVSFVLLRHCWLAALGLTYHEWLLLPSSERRCFGLKTVRPHSQGAFANLKELISV